MIGVEQEPAARVRGLGDDPAHDVEVVELLGLRVELDGELHAMTGRDVAGLAHVRRGTREIAATAVRGAHHRLAAERDRPPAGFVEGLHQLPALVAVGEHPAELDADARDAKTARRHQRQDLGRGLPFLGRTGEIDPAKLHAVPARRLRRAKRVRQRRRVEGPGMKGQHRGHGFAGGGGVAGVGVAAGAVVLGGLVGVGGLAIAYSTACFSSPSACLTSSRALTRWPPK